MSLRTSTLKTQLEVSSETFVLIYHTTRLHTLEDSNLNTHCRGSLCSLKTSLWVQCAFLVRIFNSDMSESLQHTQI